GRARSGRSDQADLIARKLGMVSHFHPALHLEDEQYGDAILSSLPMRLMRAAPLPSTGEQRGAIWVSVDLAGVELQVVNTHLGLRRSERLRQASSLLGEDLLGNSQCLSGPTILLGDFNSVP